MKGWRPSALPRLDAGSGLVKRAYHMPDIGSIGLSFREVPGAQWTRAIMKKRQPFTSLKKAGGTRNDNPRKRHTNSCERAAPAPPGASFQAGGGAKRKKAVTPKQG